MTVDATTLLAVVILAAPAILVVAGLSVVRTLVADLAGHTVTGGMARRPT